MDYNENIQISIVMVCEFNGEPGAFPIIAVSVGEVEVITENRAPESVPCISSQLR